MPTLYLPILVKHVNASFFLIFLHANIKICIKKKATVKIPTYCENTYPLVFKVAWVCSLSSWVYKQKSMHYVFLQKALGDSKMLRLISGRKELLTCWLVTIWQTHVKVAQHTYCRSDHQRWPWRTTLRGINMCGCNTQLIYQIIWNMTFDAVKPNSSLSSNLLPSIWLTHKQIANRNMWTK